MSGHGDETSVKTETKTSCWTKLRPKTKLSPEKALRIDDILTLMHTLTYFKKKNKGIVYLSNVLIQSIQSGGYLSIKTGGNSKSGPVLGK